VLFTLPTPAGRAGAKGASALVVVGRGSARGAGRSVTVRVRLNAIGRRVLRRQHKRLPAQMQTTLSSRGRRARTTTGNVVLRTAR
jgi:hypothetical protein